MKDLIERLRNFVDPLKHEAADAIEKLEAENAALKAELAAREQKPPKEDYCMAHGVYFDTRYGCQFCAASLQRTQLAAPGAMPATERVYDPLPKGRV